MAAGMMVLLSLLWLADTYVDNGGTANRMAATLRRFRDGNGNGGLRTDP